MQPYANYGGDSPITHYSILDDCIVIRYGNRNYSYYEADLGTHHLNTMKRLAKNGRGLSTYINQHPEVKNGYRMKA